MRTTIFDYFAASHIRKAMGSFFIAGIMLAVIGCLFAWVFLESLYVLITEPADDLWMVVLAFFMITSVIFAISYGCFRLSGFLRRPRSPE